MDAVFEEEQAHLSTTYEKLLAIRDEVRNQLEDDLAEALEDKEKLFDEMTRDFSADIQLETLTELEAMNRIIEGYNLSADINTEKLHRTEILLRSPYFAKISLQFPHSDQPKDIYIGAAGMTDGKRRHFIVDWRSPVAEVYYNQANGPTSYEANGRIIDVDLLLRRQFDITGDKLNACFDTTVAIEDPLLLKSLTSRHSARLSAITTTIQKEQNEVIRHRDVPALLVQGIAGSGKTSVLLQRIAYLFYTERDNLDPRDVFLITPNPVFGRYIDTVLPDMGESNPSILTWDDLMAQLGLEGRGLGKMEDLSVFQAIDGGLARCTLDPDDFCDVRLGDERILSAASARSSFDKFSHLPLGPHRCTLAIEDMQDKIAQRIQRLAKDEDEQDALLELSTDEQIRIFGQVVLPLGDEELPERTKQWLQWRYRDADRMIEEGAWLRLDRFGRRLLGKETLDAAEWLYLRLALLGGGQRHARYVMIDEVQDYTLPQLAVLARYFPQAHFLMLGDQNQAVRKGTASFDEIRDLFETAAGSVDECFLNISYRSSPEITALFCKLLPPSQQIEAASVQRPGEKPVIIEESDPEAYEEALRTAVREAAAEEGLTALVANSRSRARALAQLLEGEPMQMLPKDGELPPSGVVLLDVKLAKGLEFDHVIVPDVQEGAFPDEPLRRHRLYTAISRATQRLTLLANGSVSELLR